VCRWFNSAPGHHNRTKGIPGCWLNGLVRVLTTRRAISRPLGEKYELAEGHGFAVTRPGRDHGPLVAGRCRVGTLPGRAQSDAEMLS
jgi:hypothetical protein